MEGSSRPKRPRVKETMANMDAGIKHVDIKRPSLDDAVETDDESNNYRTNSNNQHSMDELWRLNHHQTTSSIDPSIPHTMDSTRLDEENDHNYDSKNEPRFHTPPKTERPFLDDSPPYFIHWIRGGEGEMDEVDFLLEAPKDENHIEKTGIHDSHENQGNEEKEEKVTLDRVWLSPPHHRKTPRIGTSYQVNPLPMLQTDDHEHL